MDLTGNDYLPFIKDTNSLFYHQNKNQKNKFVFKQVNDHCQKYTDDFYQYLLFNHRMPKQGWKIHITANAKDAQKLLLAVSEYLITKEVSFKFIASKEDFILSNSKYGDRCESGKFITVYPTSTNEFLELLTSLAKITQPFLEGPYILTDKEWYNSHVFYRYGAFKRMTTVIDGKIVYAIENDRHQLVEDKREPFYQKPDFIEEPSQLKRNVQQFSSDEFAALNKYKIEYALHYSNAGGVYYGILNDKEYVLKEGRAFAGLDANGQDGFDRIKYEYQVLKKLADVDEVVNVKECFKAWKHMYLVEDYLKGETLADFIDEHYPFKNDLNRRKLYAQKIIIIMNSLIQAVKKIHAHNVAIGDLQPENIILHKANGYFQIRIIDFENAQKPNMTYQPSMVTPGYSDFNAKTYAEADKIAIYKIARYAILPTAAGFDWNPEIIAEQDQNIIKEFGTEIVEFLNKMQTELGLNLVNSSRHPQCYKENLQLPKTRFTYDAIKQNTKEVASGIINNLEFNFKGLIRGDINEYDSLISNYDIANGGFGAIMALNRSDQLTPPLQEKINLWIKQQIPNLTNMLEQNDVDIGLYTGLTGIATVLFEQGFTELSEQIMTELPIHDLNQDISLYSGYSGLGLAYLSFYLITDKEIYLVRAKKQAERIIKITNNLNYTDNINTGLISGWLGAALFLWKLSLIDQNKKEKDKALYILRFVLKHSLTVDKDGAYLKESTSSYDRLVPYVNSGGAGLALLILEFLRDDPISIKQKEKELLNKLVETNDVFVTYFAGLFDGYFSLMILDNAIASCGGDDRALKSKYNNLNNYLVAKNGGVLVPGSYGFKCSLDLTTGSSGLLLLLNDIQKKKWNSWLPLLQTKKQRLFE